MENFLTLSDFLWCPQMTLCKMCTHIVKLMVEGYPYGHCEQLSHLVLYLGKQCPRKSVEKFSYLLTIIVEGYPITHCVEKLSYIASLIVKECVCNTLCEKLSRLVLFIVEGYPHNTVWENVLTLSYSLWRDTPIKHCLGKCSHLVLFIVEGYPHNTLFGKTFSPCLIHCGGIPP